MKQVVRYDPCPILVVEEPARYELVRPDRKKTFTLPSC
jgi:hypothetical protein